MSIEMLAVIYVTGLVVTGCAALDRMQYVERGAGAKLLGFALVSVMWPLYWMLVVLVRVEDLLEDL